MSKWKKDSSLMGSEIWGIIKDRKPLKEEIKLVRPLLDEQVASIHLAKYPFEPTPTFLFANLQLTRVRKWFYFSWKNNEITLCKNMGKFRLWHRTEKGKCIHKKVRKGDRSPSGHSWDQGRDTAARQSEEVPHLALNIFSPWLFVMEWSQQVTTMLPLSHQLTNVYPFGSFLINQSPHSPLFGYFLLTASPLSNLWSPVIQGWTPLLLWIQEKPFVEF